MFLAAAEVLFIGLASTLLVIFHSRSKYKEKENLEMAESSEDKLFCLNVLSLIWT